MENFDDRKADGPILTSPRSLEACLRHGVEPEDLLFRDESEFEVPGQPEEIQRLRWERAEVRRQEKLRDVMDERDKIIAHGEHDLLVLRAHDPGRGDVSRYLDEGEDAGSHVLQKVRR